MPDPDGEPISVASELDILSVQTIYPGLFEAVQAPTEKYIPDILEIMIQSSGEACPGVLDSEAGYFRLGSIPGSIIEIGMIPRITRLGRPFSTKTLNMKMQANPSMRRGRGASKMIALSSDDVVTQYVQYFIEAYSPDDVCETTRVIGMRGKERICIEFSNRSDGTIFLSSYIPSEEGYMSERHLATYALNSDREIVYFAKGDFRYPEQPIITGNMAEVTEQDTQDVSSYIELIKGCAMSAEKTLQS